MAGVLLPIAVTAHLLAVWLPKSLAWAICVFGWTLVIFWIPPKAQIPLRRWLIVVTVLSLFALVLGAFFPSLL
jgi:hypothetical protein